MPVICPKRDNTVQNCTPVSGHNQCLASVVVLWPESLPMLRMIGAIAAG